MNPKFNPNEDVYYKNELNMVTGRIRTINGWEYEIIDQINGYGSRVHETNLLSVTEWNTSHQHNQNNMGWAALKSMMGDNMKMFNEAFKKNACVCGAGAVKDARHSSWCEIEN